MAHGTRHRSCGLSRAGRTQRTTDDPSRLRRGVGGAVGDTVGHRRVWRGEHDCDGIAEALANAGFSDSVIIETVVGNELVSAARDDISDMTALCEAATVVEHSHEFTADGQFFSYNQDGDEVDFGTYEVVDDDTLTIGGSDREGVTTFDFAIEGDHLTLEPQLEEGCLTFECQWAMMVAMPWSGMERIE